MRTAIVSAVIAGVVGLILVLSAGDPDGPSSSVVIGAISGTGYGLVALGLVLVYKGARVFNFAQAEFGTMAGFVAFFLADQITVVQIPYGVAILLTLIIITGLGLAMERVLVRPLLDAPRVTLLVATIALSVLLIGFELLLFLPEVKALAEWMPTVNEIGQPVGPTIFNYIVPPQQIILIGILIALAPLLAYFFSRTDLGLAILATSQDSFATRVVGIGVERTSRFIWGASAFLGALAGLLLIPNTSLHPSVMTQQVLIPGFAAAVIGGMTSLPGAFIGGITVGVIEGLAFWASTAPSVTLGGKLIQEIIPGFPSVAVVIALLVVLLIRPQGLLGSEA